MRAVDLFVESSGTGTPVVLTHGLGDDHATWDPIWPALTADHGVVRWDLRGHGRSAAPTDPAAYTRGSAIDDLLSVVDRAGSAVTLVSHSLGGYLSLAVALRHPEIIRSLVLISSGPGFRDEDARTRWNHYVDAAAHKMVIAPGAARMCHQEDSSVIDGLPTLACPLLHLIGDGDRQYRAGADYMQRVLPAGSLITITGAGHHPQRSHPAETLAAIKQHLPE